MHKQYKYCISAKFMSGTAHQYPEHSIGIIKNTQAWAILVSIFLHQPTKCLQMQDLGRIVLDIQFFANAQSIFSY
jgi:hypothetical protein